jgi:signal transduction histidine kinase
MRFERAAYPRGSRLDLLLGAGVATFAALEVLIYGLPWASVVSVGACATALTARRRSPLLVAAAAGAVPVVDRLLGGPWLASSGALVVAVLAAYSVATFASRWQALIGGVLVLASVWLRLMWTGVADPLAFGYFAVLVGMPWLAGKASRAQRQRAKTLNVLTTELEHDRDAVERLAVTEERGRLAAELHDAIAQLVTAMLRDADAAKQALSSAPTRARVGLRITQDTGRTAIGELGRMLRVLRVDRQDPARPSRADGGPAIVLPQRKFARRWSSRDDVVLAVAVLGLLFVEARGYPVYAATLETAPVVLAFLMCLALIFRRRYPVAVLLTVTTAGVIRHLVVGPLVPFPVAAQLTLFAAVYAVAVYTPARWSFAAVGVSILELWLADAITSGAPRVTFLLALMFYSGVPLFSGLPVRGYRSQAERLDLLASRLRRERDARSRLAVLEERTRMARELHDTVAHGVNVMILHAAGAEQLLHSAPDRCRQALNVVCDVGRVTLRQLDRLLRTLAPDEHASANRGRMTLADLNELVTQTRRAGLPITLRVDGRPPRIPASIDESAFRIVQESLTNALKHAGTVPTRVRIGYDSDGVALEVVNADGRRTEQHAAQGTGHGVLGMRERVALHHGTLLIGPEPAGGFGVRAHLPIAVE